MKESITKIMVVIYLIAVIGAVQQTESKKEVKNIYCEYDRVEFVYHKCK